MLRLYAKPFQDIFSSSDIYDAGGDPELEALLESCRPAPTLDPKQPRKRPAASEDGPGVLKKKPASLSVCKRPAASDKETAAAEPPAPAAEPPTDAAEPPGKVKLEPQDSCMSY